MRFTDQLCGALIAAVLAGAALGSAWMRCWEACAVFALFGVCVLGVCTIPSEPEERARHASRRAGQRIANEVRS